MATHIMPLSYYGYPLNVCFDSGIEYLCNGSNSAMRTCLEQQLFINVYSYYIISVSPSIPGTGGRPVAIPETTVFIYVPLCYSKHFMVSTLIVALIQ